MTLAQKMTTTEVIEALRHNRQRLADAGVIHAGVFGSMATGKARADSDVDVLVVLEPDDNRTIYDLVQIERTVAEAVPGPIDVAVEDQLKPKLRDRIISEAVMAF